MKKFVVAAMLLIGLAGPSFAQSQDYIRYRTGATPQDGELQIAVESYTCNGVTVDIYGVVHMADAPYYRAVQRDLNTYNVVLYEGIKQGDAPNQGTRTLNLVQSGMSRLLALQFQKDGISYVGSNMLHADVDASTLRRSLKGKKLSPFEGMIDPALLQRIEPLIKVVGQFAEQWLAANPQFSRDLKVQMAQQISSTDIEQQLPADMKRAIIDDRNQIVMDVLARRLRTHRDRRICIFYGAGHNPDFSRRLLAGGWTKGPKRWMTAWRIGNGAVNSNQRAQQTQQLSVPPAPTPERRLPARKKAGAGVR